MCEFIWKNKTNNFKKKTNNDPSWDHLSVYMNKHDPHFLYLGIDCVSS